MATLQQVMQGIETALLTIDGLRGSDTSPDQIVPPWFFVGVPPVPSYHTSFAGPRPTLEPTITVLVSAAVSRAGQLKLAGYADPTGDQSIPAAIAADRTLGGLVNDCQITRFDPLGIEDVAAIGYWGGRFTCRVLA